jgi:hypothetical protein
VKALRKIHALLNPGGKIGFTVIACVPQIIQAITRTIGSDSKTLLDCFFHPTLEEWKKMLIDTGYEVVLGERYTLEVNYGKLSKFYDWWIGTSHGVFSTDKISPSDQQALAKMFPSLVVVDHPLIRLIATKK